MDWDPFQYERYADERGRPFGDLIARIRYATPRRVIDLGCGTGTLTARLARRWPDAVVEGVDLSEEMIRTATPLSGSRLSFRVEDVRTWQMPEDADVVVSNAVLQWVPGHTALLRTWAARLPAGGWLAVQVPGNFDAPAHALMRELANSPRWAPQLGSVLRHEDAVASPAGYAELLLDCGLTADAWETTYLHVLTGPDPVLAWMRGTGLRPVLAALSDTDADEFLAEYGARLRAAYPPTPHGTLFEFRRIFFVGSRAA